MKQRAAITDAFLYSIKETVDNIGLYFLSILATIGIIITSTIIIVGSYVLILARQSPTFQELLRLFFAGKAVTVVEGKAVATEQAIQITKTILATFSPLMMILGVCCFILFSLIIAAVMAGHIHMLLILHDTGKASISDFFSALSFAPGLYLVNLLGLLAAAMPLLLIAAPVYLVQLPIPFQVIALSIAATFSVIIWARLYLGQYFFIDGKETIRGSLRASWYITKNNLVSFILIIIISILLSSNTTLTLLSLFPFILMGVSLYRVLVPAEISSVTNLDND